MLFETLEHWVNINSGSGNPDGLQLMADALQEHLSDIPGTLERIPLPCHDNLDGSIQRPGDVLRLRFRPEAPVKVLFSGHMDTVYGPGHSFQRLQQLPDGRVNGPGVADMKGGLLIMIESVKRFLAEDKLGNLGGEILINADEEVGSRGSHALLEEAAHWNDLGLVFESALPGGELVRCRKGTGTFRVTATGKPAHTGRDFESGRSAVVAMSALALACHRLNEEIEDAIINVANFASPGPVNVVPDKAETWLNVRIGRPESAKVVKDAFARLIAETESTWEGVTFTIEGDILRAPKVETPGNAALHELWNGMEEQLGLPLSGKRDTGGSSDGNVLGEAGLPHLDGLGILGGSIHSPEEFAYPESMQTGIDKTVAFLHRLAAQPDCLKASSPQD
jgi:glutamate carboxypeptidase